jgi:hypothetical protein
MLLLAVFLKALLQMQWGKDEAKLCALVTPYEKWKLIVSV